MIELIEEIRALISKDELEQALVKLQTLLKNSPKLDEVLHQSGRFHDILKQIRLGLVSHQDANLTRNQIRVGLLDFIRELESERLKLQKQAFNRLLTRKIIEAMSAYNEKAQKLASDLGWLDNNDNRRKVQQFVFQNFVGEVGKQLRMLINIGNEEEMDERKKTLHYVAKCMDIAKSCFDIVNYTLLSTLWSGTEGADGRAKEGTQGFLL